MTVSRTVNGKPITEEELHSLNVHTVEMDKIISDVLARLNVNISTCEKE